MRDSVKKALPGLTCLVLVAATTVALSRPRTLTGDPNGAVPLVLPERLGPWTGQDLLFCSSDQCGRHFPASELPRAEDGSPSDACPDCGKPLSPVAPGEQKLLPASTPIFRRLYRRPGGPDVTATVVFSGMERRSIHRPQRCLLAQGNKITDEYSHEADLGGGKTFPLRILEFSPQNPSGGTGGVYAYWLFNPERETDSHLVRFAWMAADNILRGYRPRWGYASVAIPRDPVRPDAWKEELDSFLRLFHPVIDKVRADLDANRGKTVTVEGSSADENEYLGDNAATTKAAGRPDTP